MRKGLKLQRIVLKGATREVEANTVTIRQTGRLVIGCNLYEAIGSPARVGFLHSDGVLCITAASGANSRKLDKGHNPGLISKPLTAWLKAQKIGWGGFPAEVHEGSGLGLQGKPMIYVYLTQEAWATYSDASGEKGGELPVFPER